MDMICNYWWYYRRKFALGDGDYVKFKEVGGMTQLNDGKPRQIKVISSNSFKLFGDEDFSKYPEYTNGGIIEQVKVPKKKCYKSLKERLEIFFDETPIDPIDLSKFGRNELLYISFLSFMNIMLKIIPFQSLIINHKQMKLPKEQKNYMINIPNYQKKENVTGLQCSRMGWKIPFNVASWARAEISPVWVFLGGVVSQEIVKFTGKYTPINQLLLFDFFETVANLGDNVDRTLKGTRYDDQISIYGNEIQKKMKNQIYLWVVQVH